MATNPFLPAALMQDFTPAARNRAPAQPSAPPPAPTPAAAPAAPIPGGVGVAPPMPDPDHERRKQGWRDFLSNPQVRAGLMQFGISMLTPGVGIGEGIGHGFLAAGKQQQLTREQEIERQAREAEARQQEIENELDERRVGAYETQVEQQGRGRAQDGFTDEQKRQHKLADAEEQRLRESINSRAEQLWNSQSDSLDPTAEQIPFPQLMNQAETEILGHESGLLNGVQQLEAIDPGFEEMFWTTARSYGYEAALEFYNNTVSLMSAARNPGANVVQPEEKAPGGPIDPKNPQRKVPTPLPRPTQNPVHPAGEGNTPEQDERLRQKYGFNNKG